MEPKPIVELHTFWASYWWTVTTLDTSIRNNSLQSVHLDLITYFLCQLYIKDCFMLLDHPYIWAISGSIPNKS